MTASKRITLGTVLGLMLLSGALITPAIPFAGTMQEETQGPQLNLIHTVGRWINFALLIVFVYYLLFKVGRINEVFAAQRNDLERELKEAANRKEEAEIRWSRLQTDMSRLNEEIKQIREQAQKEAEEEEARILKMAEEEAQKFRKQAEDEIRRWTLAAEMSVRSHITDVVVALVRSLLAMEISDEDHKQLIDLSLDKFRKYMTQS